MARVTTRFLTLSKRKWAIGGGQLQYFDHFRVSCSSIAVCPIQPNCITLCLTYSIIWNKIHWRQAIVGKGSGTTLPYTLLVNVIFCACKGRMHLGPKTLRKFVHVKILTWIHFICVWYTISQNTFKQKQLHHLSLCIQAVRVTLASNKNFVESDEIKMAKVSCYCKKCPTNNVIRLSLPKIFLPTNHTYCCGKECFYNREIKNLQ